MTSEISKYAEAVQAIKTAILQSQYAAARFVNETQLSLYFGIGKYISLNSRKGYWGKGAIDAISGQLQRELPGLRGFSARSLRYMRTFYEEWSMLDSQSLAAEDRSPEPGGAGSGLTSDLAVAIAQVGVGPIWHPQVPKQLPLSQSDFFSIGFTLHRTILSKAKSLEERIFNRELNCLVAVELKTGEFKTSYLGQLQGYLSVLDGFERKPHENPPIGLILCKDMNRAFVDYVIRDYSKPMGVSTYKTADDMPERLRKALPAVEDLRRLLETDEGPAQ